MKKKLAALTLTLAVPLALAACGSDGGSEGPPTVTATTGILADITAQVAGPDADVEQLIPEGSSPHDFQLSAKDRAAVEDSMLLVSNGEGLEAGIPIDEIDVERFELTDHVQDLLPLEDDGDADPHVWMDPARVAAALPALADALAEADPDHAAGYRRRAKDYAAELTALDAEMAAELGAVPPANRELVTSHDALGYFADRYGFEVVATPFPASGAEAEASAGRIAEVEDAISATGVPTVFAEAEDDPEVLELIAGETGVAIEPGLLVESPGPAGDYVGMLRSDAALIAAGLRAPQE
ncbi:MAG TPA: metal ABC transporter substrate-binding protein [Solirubrobacterales bacterium]|nr:metal ABC transporter substrate-binding protein [Solirubrobacterales bacterium]